MGLKEDLRYVWVDSGYGLRHKIKETGRSMLYGFQRLWKGYDERAIWNLDITLVNHIRNILKDFRRYSMSHPTYMTSDEWDAILGQMIDLLNEMDRFLLSDEVPYKDFKVAKNKFFELFSDHFEDLWS